MLPDVLPPMVPDRVSRSVFETLLVPVSNVLPVVPLLPVLPVLPVLS
jgi:hypothetical protein